MPYIINNTRGQTVAVIPDGTIDTTSTSLQLVGRSVTEYGVPENENYVALLENFANETPPPNPIQGQLWYDIANNAITAWTINNTWEGLASQNYVQAQKVSPIFTGIPQAPTANVNTSTNQIATTAFVKSQFNNLSLTGVPTAPTAPRCTSNAQIATTEFVANSVCLHGTPTAPTPDVADNSNVLATTAFVKSQFSNAVLTGNSVAVTAPRGTATTQIATTAFVTKDPIFTGVPEAPTAPAGTANAQIASTAFVTNSPEFLGTPRAPTAAAGTSTTQLATTAFVTTSPQFAGTPTAPTAAKATNTTQLATTAFVQEQKVDMVLTGVPRAPTPVVFPTPPNDQIATVGWVAQQVATIDLTPYAKLNSPSFSGIPTAPTAAAGTTTTQLATTKFVMDAIKGIPDDDQSGALWQGSAKFVSTSNPNPASGVNGDFWFRYTA